MVSIVLGGDITEELGSELVILLVVVWYVILWCTIVSIGDAMIGPVKSKEDYVSEPSSCLRRWKVAIRSQKALSKKRFMLIVSQ